MKSFLQGKKSLPLSGLRAPLTPPAPSAQSCSTSRTAVNAGGHAPGHAHTPGASSASVEVVKEGDKVVRLIVTCVCGERVEVECLYPAGT
ncbi:MAG: hypothetical protein NTV51_12255 [Verrucomicrobia bacterium]|nr:hypothetical protein [Verrucomicrobiota bacterium]